MSHSRLLGNVEFALVLTGLVVAGLVAVLAVSPVLAGQQIAPPATSDVAVPGDPLYNAYPTRLAKGSDTTWPMGRANPANTNYINTTGPTDPITVRWRFRSEADAFPGNPVVANGTLYFGTAHYGLTQDAKLYAVDAWTGEVEWTFQKGSSLWVSSIAVLRNTVYVASSNGKVYALDAASGDVYWTFSAGERPSITVADRTLYVNAGNHVYALGALRGQEKWAFKPDGRPSGSPAVKDGTVYISSRQGNVTALAAETGAVQWSVDIVPESGNSWLKTPSVANGLVFVSNMVFHNTCSDKDDYCSDSYVYALDADTGAIEWTRSKPRADGFSTPVVLGNTAYFRGKVLHAVNIETGTDRWQSRTLKRTPVLLNDIGYVRTGKTLYTLNPETGAHHARFTPAPYNNSWDRYATPMVTLNGSLYTGFNIDIPNTNHRSDRTIFYALGTPEFNFTNLSVSSRATKINNTVNATVTVRNTGTGPGTYNATLTVDGAVTHAKTGRLEPRTTTTVTFPLVFQTNGTHTVGIANLTRTITVGEVSPSATPTTRVEVASPTPTVSPSPTTTRARREKQPTPTPTSAPTPGFGATSWFVSFILLAELVRLHKRN